MHTLATSKELVTVDDPEKSPWVFGSEAWNGRQHLLQNLIKMLITVLSFQLHCHPRNVLLICNLLIKNNN